MQACDLRDERNEEQLQRLNDSESNAPPPPPPPCSSAFDVGALAAYLRTVWRRATSRTISSSTRTTRRRTHPACTRSVTSHYGPFAPAAGLPCYAEDAARKQAAAESEEDDSGVSETESEKRRARARRGVRRWLDDEAEETDDQDSDGATATRD